MTVQPASPQKQPLVFCAQYVADTPLMLPLGELVQIARKEENLSNEEKNILNQAHLYMFCKSSETDLNKEEILYIGQSFGTNGEGDLLKRLTSDPELVEIIEKAKEKWPEDIFSICLLPFLNEPYLLPASGKEQKDMEETPELRRKLEKIQRIQMPLRRQNDLIEAALIHHFTPLYNKEYSKKFPSALAKLLEKFSQAFIATLLIEFSTESLEIEFFSQDQLPRKHVLLPFDISTKQRRKEFLLPL